MDYTHYTHDQPRILSHVNVLGVGVHAVDMPQALGQIFGALESGKKGYVCVTGVHGVMESQRDERLRNTLNRALLNVPDGMPTVWLGRLQGHRRMRRVFGPELMAEVCRISPRFGYRHFLYGGQPGVAEQLKERLVSRFPGLQIVGTFTPPFRPLLPAEARDFEDQIARLRPHIVWIGLSTPKQERFMAESIDRLSTNLLIGVGAAFDYHTGRIKDAPRWIKQSGLQWAHRIAQDPKRLWKRYATNNPRFMAAMSLQLLGIRRHPIQADSPGERPDPR